MAPSIPRPAALLALFALPLLLSLSLQRGMPSGALASSATDYEAFYRPIAESLLDGRGYHLSGFAAPDRYPPGYPLLAASSLFLARSLGLPEESVVHAFNAACHGLSALALFLTAELVFGFSLALIPYFLWVSYPLVWLTLPAPLTEHPFCSALFFALYLLAKSALRGGSWRLFAAGILLGAAMLIRPVALLLPLLLAALWSLGSIEPPRRSAAVLLLAGALIPVAPWELWLRARTGHWIPLSTGGPASVVDGLTFAADLKSYRVPAAVPRATLEVSRAFLLDAPQLRSVPAILDAVHAQLRRSPAATAQFFAVKAARAWYATDSGRNHRPLLALQSAYLSLILAGLFFSLRGPLSARRLALLVLCVAALFWAMTTAVLSIVRYMVPAMGLLFLPVPALVRLASPPSAPVPERQ